MLDSIDRATEDLRNRLESTTAPTAAIDHGLADVAARLSAVERLQRIESVSRWISHAVLKTQPLVSVIIPTVDRTRLLRRALESVLAQRYGHFEVVVVADGGHEGTKAVVDDLGDPRIRWSRIPKGGVAAARNAALALAHGQIVTYLDDDNMMDREWLYSVVWAFEQRPDVDVLYGAVVVDDPLRINGESPGEVPQTFLQPWQREPILETDMGTMAHRDGLAEARFDEGLSYHADGDLLVRLTADRDPLVLPVVACYYTTDDPNRVTVTGWTAADRERSARMELDHAQSG